MDPLFSSLGGAGLKSAGSLVSRYRPVGVARIGSPEDRAQTYRRFLDAATRLSLAVRHSSFPEPPDALQAHVLVELMGAVSELASAIASVQLCGSAPVIAAAEQVDWRRFMSSYDADETGATDIYSAQCRSFIDEARRELAYNPRWWQLWRKRKERKLIAKRMASSQVTVLPSPLAVTARDD